MRWIAGVFLVLLSCSSWAMERPWMKQADPNSLGLFVAVSDICPFETAELEGRFEGEFLRARIKPTKSTDLNITVSVTCMTIKTDSAEMGTAVAFIVQYGTKMPTGHHVLYESPDYGSLAIGGVEADSRQFLINSITDSVSLALTEYLKANFQ